MNNWFLNIYIDRGWVMWTAIAITTALVLLLLPIGHKQVVLAHQHEQANNAQEAHARQSGWWQRHWYTIIAAQVFWTVLMGVLGWIIVYLLSNVFVVFGVGLGDKVFMRVACGFAGVGYAISSAVMYRGWRRTIAFCLIPAAIVLSALQVNAAYGQYSTVRDVLGMPHFTEAHSFPRATTSVDDYLGKVKAGSIEVPKYGRIHSVAIPATESHFKARHATVYIPPAALTKDVPFLPVLMLLPGQPGNPSTFFTAGHMGEIADAYASKHHGLAPVIISPDQLGNRFHNTLCADTIKYGKAQTYLMKDVVNWMEKKLPVTTNHKQWGIGGFSQGGTCSVELGPAYPHLFHYVIDVAGEDGPHAGSAQNMIENYFGGNKAAYKRHLPKNTFSSHPYQGQRIIFGAGQLDTLGQANCRNVSQYARQNGWSIQSVMSYGSAHDWTTVRAVTTYALADFGYMNGLGDKLDLSSFKGITHIAGIEPTAHHAHTSRNTQH
ncbi:alpha/beta hydrolase [Alloscardovia omnicolens]|uniref:alpha/beta hydrolase n=1 Tax=Alloscardovia omnicolens TaxID=419015 RepID=UPI0037579DC1